MQHKLVALNVEWRTCAPAGAVVLALNACVQLRAAIEESSAGSHGPHDKVLPDLITRQIVPCDACVEHKVQGMLICCGGAP